VCLPGDENDNKTGVSGKKDSKQANQKSNPVKKESVSTLFNKYKAAYADYLRNIRKNTEETINQEIRAFSRLPPISSPEDLTRVKLTRWQQKGLRKFITYLDDVKGIPDPLGVSTARWLKLIKVDKAQSRQKNATDKDIIAGYDLIDEKYKTFYKLKVYSGSRTEHIYQMLKEYDPSKVIVEGEIARYPTAHLAKGDKRTYFIFFPAFLLKETERYQLPKGRKGDIVTSGAVQNGLNVGNVDNNIIRAWFFNLLVSHKHAYRIDRDVADFIQGRAPKNISAEHYLERTEQAVEGLNKILDRFPKLN
jgi:intergrase/recombinase